MNFFKFLLFLALYICFTHSLYFESTNISESTNTINGTETTIRIVTVNNSATYQNTIIPVSNKLIFNPETLGRAIWVFCFLAGIILILSRLNIINLLQGILNLIFDLIRSIKLSEQLALFWKNITIPPVYSYILEFAALFIALIAVQMTMIYIWIVNFTEPNAAIIVDSSTFITSFSSSFIAAAVAFVGWQFSKKQKDN